jgi:hypothetical protein
MEPEDLKFLPFYPSEILEALADSLRENRNKFSPHLASVDLDEFFGLNVEIQSLELPFVIVSTLQGTFNSDLMGQSSDKIQGSANIFSDIETANAKENSNVLLGQLVTVLRSDHFQATLAGYNKTGTMIESVLVTGFTPDNTFVDSNIAGWSVGFEISCGSYPVKGAPPTIP